MWSWIHHPSFLAYTSFSEGLLVLIYIFLSCCFENGVSGHMRAENWEGKIRIYEH